MRMSCLESALDHFVNRTLEAVRGRGDKPMRVSLSQHGRIGAVDLAERARRKGFVAHNFGDYTVVIRAPQS